MNEIILKPPQETVFCCDQRFRVLVAGRRFGKTYLAVVELIRAAWPPGSLVWYVAPTYKQAKRIAWKQLKALTRPYWAGKPNETDLRIELLGGSTICLCGAEDPDSLRGHGLNFVVVDEYASMKREAWSEVLFPALADKQGGALLIGTPRGYDHFYDLFQGAQNRPHWAAFQFTTAEGGNVLPEELENATHELDQRTYGQEFGATFENTGVGLVYHAFDRARNVQPARFEPRLPLFWSLDFNMNPMCSVIGQQEGNRVVIFDELVLPDSHTWAACEEFLARTSRWISGYPVQVRIYGDATGDGRKTSSSRTDVQIVRDFFGRYPDRFRVEFHIPASNPPVKDRANCVNALLRNQAGERRLVIDVGCKQLIEDFERVHWKADSNGNGMASMDKSDKRRTHVSDALGYMIAQAFPMRMIGGPRSGYLA
jgi:hypothetical protein